MSKCCSKFRPQVWKFEWNFLKVFTLKNIELWAQHQQELIEPSRHYNMKSRTLCKNPHISYSKYENCESYSVFQRRVTITNLVDQIELGGKLNKKGTEYQQQQWNKRRPRSSSSLDKAEQLINLDKNVNCTKIERSRQTEFSMSKLPEQNPSFNLTSFFYRNIF